MRILIAFILSASSAFAQISVPATTPPYEPIVATVAFPAAGDSQVIWEFGPTVKTIQAGSTTLHVWAPPGQHTLGATVISIDWDQKKFSVLKHAATFVVTGSPVVPPGPITPPVIPPITPAKLTAIIVHETEDDSPAFLRLVVGLRNPNGNSSKWIKDHGHKLLICDDDSVDEAGHPSQVVAKIKALGVQLPLVAFLDDKSDVRATKVIDQDESDGAATTADAIVEWMRQNGG